MTDNKNRTAHGAVHRPSGAIWVKPIRGFAFDRKAGYLSGIGCHDDTVMMAAIEARKTKR
jgi:transcriptional/translational regulatory protein YebC/TACO1